MIGRASRPRRGWPMARVLHDGLAVFDVGEGVPLLVMPNPQGMVLASEIDGPLVRVLAEAGRRIITFDPPGAFASTRPPRLGLAEMVACAQEALQVAQVDGPVTVAGHSQATLCALALALRAPRAVASLVLVGAVDGGWRATKRAGGMPWCWRLGDRRLWQFVWLAAPLALGRSNLARLARLQRLFLAASFVDRQRVPAVSIVAGGERLPPPARARWQLSIHDVDLRPRLGGIEVPALACVGRHDPQTPVRSNAEIANLMPYGLAEVFDHSGHYPHVEEPERFRAVVGRFLSHGAPSQQPGPVRW